MRTVLAASTVSLSTCTRDFRPNLPSTGWSRSYDDSEPVCASVDATRIEQIVGNLLQNAARFTPAKGKASLSLRVLDDKPRFA